MRAPIAVALLTVGVAGTRPAASQTDPTPAPTTMVATAAIMQLLAELDQAFARGDTKAYAAAFDPDVPGLHAAMLQRLAATFAATTGRSRRSTLVGAPHQIGAHTVLRVRHETELHGGPHALRQLTTCADDELLAIRRVGDRCVVTLAVDTVPAPQSASDRFRCPPCNYELGGVAGFLAVPMRPDRAGALEAVCFYRLGSDVVVDVSVQVDAEPRAAAQVAQQLADTLHRLEPGSSLGVVEPWLPPSHCLTQPSELSGARVVITLPERHEPGRQGPGGQDQGHQEQVRCHVTTFGGLQHVLLVRGSLAGLRQEAPAIDALLASFRLLDTDRDRVAAALAAMSHHTGGVLTGSSYTNSRYGVELPGDPTWRAVMLTGGAALRVQWTSPHGSRLWLVGHLVPPGLERWCEGSADRWLEQLCERAGVQLRTGDAGSTPWQPEAAGGGSARTRCGQVAASDRAEVPRRRWFRVLRRDDLLLIADGFATTADDDAALQRMLATLRRR